MIDEAHVPRRIGEEQADVDVVPAQACGALAVDERRRRGQAGLVEDRGPRPPIAAPEIEPGAEGGAARELHRRRHREHVDRARKAVFEEGGSHRDRGLGDEVPADVAPEHVAELVEPPPAELDGGGPAREREGQGGAREIDVRSRELHRVPHDIGHASIGRPITRHAQPALAYPVHERQFGLAELGQTRGVPGGRRPVVRHRDERIPHAGGARTGTGPAEGHALRTRLQTAGHDQGQRGAEDGRRPGRHGVV